MKTTKVSDVHLKRATEELRAAGFFVETDVSFALGRSNKRLHADLVAWAPDETGELIRDLIVDVRETGPDSRALAQLSRVASVAGAQRAFVFTDEWLAVDPAFTLAKSAPTPRPVHHPTHVHVPREVLEQVAVRMLWNTADEVRTEGGSDEKAQVTSALLDRLEAKDPRGDIETLVKFPGAELSFARILAEAHDELGVSAELASALARLLSPSNGMSVLDPFCGAGGCLLATAEEARARGDSVAVYGWYPSDALASLARRLASFGKVTADIQQHSILPPIVDLSAVARGPFDAVISVLPFNTKADPPFDLSNGEQTRSVDVAMVDSIAGWLKPNGRAVLVVAPRLLFADGDAARLRAHLASTMRVVSLIELPSVFKNTQVKATILVLEKKAPGETLVASLTEDWREQLSPAGDFCVPSKHTCAERQPYEPLAVVEARWRAVVPGLS